MCDFVRHPKLDLLDPDASALIASAFPANYLKQALSRFGPEDRNVHKTRLLNGTHYGLPLSMTGTPDGEVARLPDPSWRGDRVGRRILTHWMGQLTR